MFLRKSVAVEVSDEDIDVLVNGVFNDLVDYELTPKDNNVLRSIIVENYNCIINYDEGSASYYFSLDDFDNYEILYEIVRDRVIKEWNSRVEELDIKVEKLD